MSATKVVFNCPTETVKAIDELAKADHRDRTSMLNKAIDFYLSHHAPKTNSAPAKKATR